MCYAAYARWEKVFCFYLLLLASYCLYLPCITAAIESTREDLKTSSVWTTWPFSSARGIRQFGYSVLVPGWFCERFSPTASTRATCNRSGGEQAIVFHNSDARAKAAGEFLNWFLQPEQVIKWSQKTGMLPVTKSVAKSDKYLDWVKKEQPSLIPF